MELQGRAAFAWRTMDAFYEVIDLYSIKPVDLATLTTAARETGRLVLVEDLHPKGGLGEAILETLAVGGLGDIAATHLAVTDMLGWSAPDWHAPGLCSRDYRHAARPDVTCPAPSTFFRYWPV